MKKKSTQFRWLVTMLLLVTAMTMPKMAWAQVTPTKPANGDGTAEKPYEITTAAELAWFRDWVNTCEVEDSHRDACAKLMADIDMSSLCHPADDSKGVAELSWSPISDVAKNNTAPIFMWRGQFDGNGKTISNLYINATSDYQGLFGWVFSNDETIKGVIKNLTLANVNVKNTVGCTGALIGGADNFEITQVVISSGTVEGEGQGIGGICGQVAAESKFLSCENRAQIKSQNDNCSHIGGICGNLNSSHIEKCANYGNINSQGFNVGGICGSSSKCSITTSANYGDIVGNRFVGGIIGYASSNESISNSLTTGDVKSIISVAGFVIGGCYYAITLSETVAYNSGATLTDGENTYTKAIGDTDSSASVTGSCTGYTTADFNSGHVAWTLNQGSTDGTQVWYQNLSADGGDAYPVLKSTGGNTVYSVPYCDGTGTAYSNSNEAVHRMPEETTLNSEQHIYQKVCQTDGCGHIGYYATSDGSVEAKETEDGFVADALTLEDATPYDNQAVFTVTDFKYTRTFSNTNWTTWYVPFNLTLTKDICDKFAFSRINNVHQYDTDNDGNADKTVVESFRQTAGVTLKANYPYLVKALSESDLNMELNLKNVKPALAEAQSIDCQSVDYKYVFTGTYKEMGESGATLYDPYTLYSDGTWQHYHSLEPMRHYLTISSRNATTSSAAFMRSILLSVIGDEDATGIVKIYDEERRAKETYDLGGRRIPAGSQRNGFYIENGKVIYKK